MDSSLLNSLLLIGGLIATILILIGKYRWSSFLVLLLCAWLIGLLSGIPTSEITPKISEDMGSLFGEVALIIILGVLLGNILEKSGAAVLLAEQMMKTAGRHFPGLAMGLAGYIISIPVYCDSGFILLNSIRQSLAEKARCHPVKLSIALGGGLFATHALVPPTPGPAAAAIILELSPSQIIPAALLIALVATLVAVAWGSFSCRWIDESTIPEVPSQEQPLETEGSPWSALIPILLPLALMSAANFQSAGHSGWSAFLSEPVNALLLGLFAALPLFKKCSNSLQQLLNDSIQSSASIILIITAGGALAGMLAHTGHVARITQSLPESAGLLLPFLIAATFKTAQGSTTVALISAVSMVESLLPGLGLDTQNGRLLTLLSAGAGSMVMTHANDSYFWVVTQFTGMDTTAGYKSLTVASLLQGLSGLLVVLLLATFLL